VAPRDPNKSQLDFPQLVADIIRDLRLTGTLGLLEFSDQMVPVYIAASRTGALALTVTPATFGSAQIHFGEASATAVNAIVVDTLALPAGTYDIFGELVGNGTGAGFAHLQHRNAANDTTLATLAWLPGGGGTDVGSAYRSVLLPMSYTIGLNERLRCIILIGGWAGEISCRIGARIQPTP